jgi:hypothetical protein
MGSLNGGRSVDLPLFLDHWNARRQLEVKSMSMRSSHWAKSAAVFGETMRNIFLK